MSIKSFKHKIETTTDTNCLILAKTKKGAISPFFRINLIELFA